VLLPHLWVSESARTVNVRQGWVGE
jgi:hypothetical protein